MQQGERERALLALGETVSPAGSETTRPQLGLGEDGGYLAALALAVKQSLDSLPSAGAIRATATRRAASCARAQAQRHASAGAADADASADADADADADAIEALATQAGSVLCLHALIAAAAAPDTSPREAELLDRLYLDVAALTMLDGLLDADPETIALLRARGSHPLAQRLAAAAARASERAGTVRNAAHHRLTVAGVVAYYASAPANGAGESAHATFLQLEASLRPQLRPALLTLRAWRALKRLRLVSSASARRTLPASRSRVCGGGDAHSARVDLVTPLETRRSWRE